MESIKNLVIVESPSKSNTIQKYLGKDYKVVPSVGHIRDLSTRGKGGLGVDIDNNFKADYVISEGKSKTVAELKKLRSRQTMSTSQPTRTARVKPFPGILRRS